MTNEKITEKDLYDPEIYCPICGNILVEEEGLTVCYYCGWSEDSLEE